MPSFDYIQTRNEIIEGAFRIVGALDVGNTLSAEMLDQGVKALQLLIKSWSNKHFFLWSFNLQSFSTVANQNVYDTDGLSVNQLDPAIIGIDKAWVVDSGDDIPIRVVSYSRYLDIVDKEENTGRPFILAYKPTPSPSVYLWPEPDDVYQVKIAVVLPLANFDLDDDEGDIPARFQRALKYGLAEDLYDEYPSANLNTRQYIQQKAAELFMEAKSSDTNVETSSEVEGMYARRR